MHIISHQNHTFACYHKYLRAWRGIHMQKENPYVCNPSFIPKRIAAYSQAVVN